MFTFHCLITLVWPIWSTSHSPFLMKLSILLPNNVSPSWTLQRQVIGFLTIALTSLLDNMIYRISCYCHFVPALFSSLFLDIWIYLPLRYFSFLRVILIFFCSLFAFSPDSSAMTMEPDANPMSNTLSWHKCLCFLKIPYPWVIPRWGASLFSQQLGGSKGHFCIIWSLCNLNTDSSGN